MKKVEAYESKKGNLYLTREEAEREDLTEFFEDLFDDASACGEDEAGFLAKRAQIVYDYLNDMGFKRSPKESSCA